MGIIIFLIWPKNSTRVEFSWADLSYLTFHCILHLVSCPPCYHIWWSLSSFTVKATSYGTKEMLQDGKLYIKEFPPLMFFVIGVCEACNL